MEKAKYSSYKPSKTLWQGEIPSHWQETEIRMLFSDNKTKNMGLIERNLLSLSYGKLKRKDIDNATGLVPASFEGYQIIENGYIVLRFTDLQNDKKSLRVGYANERGIITSAYVGLAPKTDIHSKYFYYQLHFLDKIKYFYNLGGGVRQSLAFKEFGRETILIPEIEEQTAIANFLDYKLAKINRFIRKKKQLIKLLNEQKAAIINQAVTKGLDPNVKMKDSGIEWLGEIPEHWEVKPIKYLVSCNDESLTDKTDKDYQLRYIDIGNVDSNGNVSEIVSYNFKDAPSRARRIVKEGDIIVSTVRTYLKAIMHINDDTENLIVSTGFAVLRPRKNVFSEFLNFAIRANYFIGKVVSESNGVSYPAINSTELITFKIAVPLIDEQKQIVQFIDRESKIINTTISIIEKEIALVEEYKTTLIAEAVTGKIDVRDFIVPETMESESFEELDLVEEDESEIQNEELEE
jgi:type I restriction enzyme S subunit